MYTETTVVQDIWKCFVIVFTSKKVCLFCVCALGLILVSTFYLITEIILAKAYLTILLALLLTSLVEREMHRIHRILAIEMDGCKAKILWTVSMALS